MGDTTRERWRTVERFEQQGDKYLLQQEVTVTASPAEAGPTDTTEGLTELPSENHRILRLDTVVEYDAREDSTS